MLFRIFIPRLANPNVLVITAADADHPSFGCRDKAKWTYFGDAFFNVALRQARRLPTLLSFLRARWSKSTKLAEEALRAVIPKWQVVQSPGVCYARP